MNNSGQQFAAKNTMWFKNRPKKAGNPSPEPPNLTETETAILRKIAQKVVDFQMTVPAVLFLESVKPLNFVGSQVMHFFQPFVLILFTTQEYEKFALMMERRENLERLICIIEELDNEQHRKTKG